MRLDAEFVRQAFGSVLLAASDDDTRALTNVLVEVHDGSVIVWATNGHWLARYYEKNGRYTTDEKILLHRDTVEKLLKTLGKSKRLPQPFDPNTVDISPALIVLGREDNTGLLTPSTSFSHSVMWKVEDYPDVARLFDGVLRDTSKEGSRTASVEVWHEYLADISKSAKVAAIESGIKIRVGASVFDPVMFNAGTDVMNWAAILMPRNIEKRPNHDDAR